MLRAMSRRRYTPMTLDNLRAIARDAPSPVVKRLLWEIKRLRLVEARATDVVRGGSTRLDKKCGFVKCRTAAREFSTGARAWRMPRTQARAAVGNSIPKYTRLLGLVFHRIGLVGRVVKKVDPIRKR